LWGAFDRAPYSDTVVVHATRISRQSAKKRHSRSQGQCHSDDRFASDIGRLKSNGAINSNGAAVQRRSPVTLYETKISREQRLLDIVQLGELTARRYAGLGQRLSPHRNENVYLYIGFSDGHRQSCNT